MSSSGAVVPGPGVTATPVTNNSNMYRVGDYVFFENSASGPYAIRRIEELNKTQNGELIIADKDIINLKVEALFVFFASDLKQDDEF